MMPIRIEMNKNILVFLMNTRILALRSDEDEHKNKNKDDIVFFSLKSIR